VFFDAATTQMRADLLTRAIEAGKDVYCEKPVADTLDKAVAVAKLAKAKKAKNGVVQAQLFLPGLRKIRTC
jgi:predicted dehydrogenase